MNELWEPPEMLLGELYASSLKTVGLCLVYAPLWPWAYPLTTIALLFNYGCTKVGVAYWYKKPPMVSEELMTKFRSRLGLLMLLHTLVAFLAADAADPAVEAGLFAVGRAPSVPVVAMFFAWVVYELLDLPDVLSLIPGLGPKDELSRSGTPTCLIWARRAYRIACQCSSWRPSPHRYRGHEGHPVSRGGRQGRGQRGTAV